MRYDRAEVLTLIGLVALLVAGIVLVVPQVVGRTQLPPSFSDDTDAQEVVELLLDGPTVLDVGADGGNREQPLAPDGTTARQGPENPGVTPETPAGIPSTSVETSFGGSDNGTGLSSNARDAGGSLFYVQLSGAVARPGVVAVREGSRLFQVLEEVGGPTDEAAVDLINLAVPVSDGQLIYIPTYGELRTGKTRDGLSVDRLYGCFSTQQGVNGDSNTSEGAGGGPAAIDLNSAEYEALVAVPGIGPTLARRILTYRSDNGPFGAIEELQNVTGIGEATLRELSHYLRVE